MTFADASDAASRQKMHALAYLYDHLKDLPAWLQRLTPEQMQHVAALLSGWQQRGSESAVRPLEETERREYIRALIASNGDVGAAAKALGIGKTTFYRRLKEWNFTAEDWRRIYQSATLASPWPTQMVSCKKTQSSAELPNDDAMNP